MRRHGKGSRRVINSRLYDYEINLESRGWIKGIKKQPHTHPRCIWLTPKYKVPFLWQKVAVEFQQLYQLVQDERLALNAFVHCKKGLIKISDFILGGNKAVRRHISGEVDTYNIISLAKSLDMELSNLGAITTTRGQVRIVATCCKDDGSYIGRKNRTTNVFDYEVAIHVNTRKPKPKPKRPKSEIKVAVIRSNKKKQGSNESRRRLDENAKSHMKNNGMGLCNMNG